MEKIINPARECWAEMVKRPIQDNDELKKICGAVFNEVQQKGDAALRKYTWYFDKARVDGLKVGRQEFDDSEALVPESLKEAIRFAASNISAFHKKQLPGKCEYVNEQGFRCWQEVRGIDKVGLYVPGGSAPLFSSVLMLAIPARLAGCRDIILCTPPDSDGKINPVILWAARYCGVERVYKLGGIQAIAAMTLGTESVPAVYKIFGPGNQYVTAAKLLAATYGVATDMPAGPSEVLVLADNTAYPGFVAADLLSQAEHGQDSQVLLVTWCADIVTKVEAELAEQLERLPRKDIAREALKQSRCIVFPDRQTCMEFVNDYAPEHLIVCVNDYQVFIPEIRNAGSVFLGNYSPESAGDYASGTNHTLPTNSFAKTYSGINMDAFVRKISFQEITEKGLQFLAPAIMEMAEAEKLSAHRMAVQIRIRR